MSRSQGCADTSTPIQRFVLASANQPGTSVLLSPPTFFFFFLKHTAHKVSARRLRMHRNNWKRHSVRSKKRIIERKKHFAELYDPSEQTSIYRCAMFAAPGSLSYKKLRLVILNHLGESIAHYATLLADVTVKASESNILPP